MASLGTINKAAFVLLAAIGSFAPALAQNAATMSSEERADCIQRTTAPALVHIKYSFKTAAGETDSVQGSGFLIKSDGYVLTDAHVLRPPPIYTSPVINSAIEVHVGNYFGTPLPATLMTKLDELDVALLKIPQQLQPWPFAQVNFFPGTQSQKWLFAMGYPGDADATGVGPGRVNSQNAIINGQPTPWLQSNLDLSPGMSGGPIFDEFGEVMGLAGAIRTASAGVTSYIIPITSAATLISLAGVADYQASECGRDPQPIVEGFIRSIVAGTLDLTKLSSSLKQAIQQQTGGSGRYKDLDALGNITGIEFKERKAVPVGTWFTINVTHEHGSSYWLVAYNRNSGLIESANITKTLASQVKQ